MSCSRWLGGATTGKNWGISRDTSYEPYRDFSNRLMVLNEEINPGLLIENVDGR